MPKPQRGRVPQPHTTNQSSPAELTAKPALGDQNGSAADVNPARAQASARRPTYPDAVARYEHGVRELQGHQYQEAAKTFRSVLAQYPEEKELNDRVRLYLAVCERHLQGAPEPRTAEERRYAATLALNAGDPQTAVRHLTAIVAQDPNHDAALYMLGVAHALTGDHDQALSYLQRAIEQNPANRAIALQDGDLERLMQDDCVRAAVEATAGARPDDVRTSGRHRPIR